MNLTDDMMYMQEMVTESFERNEFDRRILNSEEKQSYYENVSSEIKLMKYDFETMQELRDYLEKQWIICGKEYMLKYVPFCVVTAMKNKENVDKSISKSISMYIYEF